MFSWWVGVRFWNESRDVVSLSRGCYVVCLSLRFTALRKSLCTWLRECCRQVEAELISNSRNKLHQTTYKDFFSALYRGLIKRIWLILFLLFFYHHFLALSAEFSQPGASLFWRPLFVISPLPSFSSRVESLTKFPPFLRRKGTQRAFRVRAPFLPASASFLILDKTTRGSYY